MAIKFFDVEKDTHAEFVKKYKDGDLVLSVQTNAAGYLFKDILSEYAGRQATFRMILFGGFAGGIIAIFFVGWWSVIGFIIGIIGQRMSNAHTDKSVIEEALKNEQAYEVFATSKILAYNSTD